MMYKKKLAFRGISNPFLEAYINWVVSVSPEDPHHRRLLAELIPVTLREYRFLFQDIGLPQIQKIVPSFLEIFGYFSGDQPFPYSDYSDASVRAYQDLKKNLFFADSPDWIRFTGRSDKVYKWCYVMIKDIVLAPLLPMVPPEKQASVQNNVLGLASMMVIFDTQIDDLADVFHDRFLIESTRKVISSPPECVSQEISQALDAVSDYKNGVFFEFFKDSMGLWRQILDHVIGSTAHCGVKGAQFLKQFTDSVKDLMDAMAYAVDVNTSRKLPSLPDLVTSLSANMMVKIVFDIIEIEFGRAGVFFPESTKPMFDRCQTMFQSSFRLSKNIATRERGMAERDMTNTIFVIAEQYLEGQFQVWQTTHSGQTFRQFISGQTMANRHSQPVDWDNFSSMFDLTSHQRASALIQSIRSHVPLDMSAQLLHGVNGAKDIISLARSIHSQDPALNIQIQELEDCLQKEAVTLKTLCEFLLKNPVLETVYRYWKDQARQLACAIDDTIQSIPLDYSHRDAFATGLNQYFENNGLFLLGCLVISKIQEAS